MDPMIPFLSGWLLGCILREGRDAMKIHAVVPDIPDAFVVTFASGLRLRVQVTEESPPATGEKP